MENKLNELRKRMIEAELHKVVFSNESKQRVINKVNKPKSRFFLLTKQIFVGLSMALCIGILVLFVINGIGSDNLTKNHINRIAGTKNDLTVHKAVQEGHIVVEQTSDDNKAYYDKEANAVKVYNLEKIFAFEDNVDGKGNTSELKITIFQKDFYPLTLTLSFDGKVIHFKDPFGKGQEYTCKDISTFQSGGSVNLYNCVDKDEGKLGTVFVFADNKRHFEKVKEEYKEKIEKQGKG